MSERLQGIIGNMDDLTLSELHGMVMLEEKRRDFVRISKLPVANYQRGCDKIALIRNYREEFNTSLGQAHLAVSFAEEMYDCGIRYQENKNG